MNREKKWMVTLERDQYEWLKRTAGEVKVKGAIIIKELIAQTMHGKDQKFRDQLIAAQAKARRQELEAKKAEIEAQLKRLAGAGDTTGDNV